MKNDKQDIQDFAAVSEAGDTNQFWKRVFIGYAIIEIFIIGSQYFITWNQCAACVKPPVFYLVNWLQHLLFTAMLWRVLDHFKKIRSWKAFLLNTVVFFFYYFLWVAVLYLLINSGQQWLVGKQDSARPVAWFIYHSWAEIGKYVLKASAFYALCFYVEYRKAERQRIRLAMLNKDMQVNLLKQQLSPHFYFNTLNNLYGLARLNSEKLSQALDQLSNIMRYVIIDCNQPKVLLEQEIRFLESYIALEKLRYEPHTVIDMNVHREENQPAGQEDGLKILPLLLIQFVENAFKHGMKEKSEKNWMKVDILIYKEEILFRVDNSYYAASAYGGIGINSVRHILDLEYEGKHTLEILDEDNRFSVTLKLNLT